MTSTASSARWPTLLAGDIDLATRVEERRKSYAALKEPGGYIHVELDTEESETDTVVEVHADDDIGLLYRLASALADRALDVRLAKVATLGRRVVDVFYVRDADGHKITEPDAVEDLRTALVERMTG